MKIGIDSDERYPHYYFYPDKYYDFDLDISSSYTKKVEITEEEFKELDRIRNEERKLQERLEELFENSNRH